MSQQQNLDEQLYHQPWAAANDDSVQRSIDPTQQAHATDMYGRVEQFLASQEGHNLTDYLQRHGKNPIALRGVGAGYLPDHAVAAVIHNGLEGVLVGNYNGRSFEERVQEMADRYHLDPQSMVEYVLSHELAHAAGYDAEADVEGLLKDYFAQQMQHAEGPERQRYQQLHEISGQREQQQRTDRGNHQEKPLAIVIPFQKGQYQSANEPRAYAA